MSDTATPRCLSPLLAKPLPGTLGPQPTLSTHVPGRGDSPRAWALLWVPGGAVGTSGTAVGTRGGCGYLWQLNVSPLDGSPQGRLVGPRGQEVALVERAVAEVLSQVWGWQWGAGAERAGGWVEEG